MYLQRNTKTYFVPTLTSAKRLVSLFYRNNAINKVFQINLEEVVS